MRFVRSGTVTGKCRASAPDVGCRDPGPDSSLSVTTISSMGAAQRLPPSFTSAYRLFLRASSASVLHHRAATRYVRTLWKPTFREAAVVIHKLQSPTLGIPEKEQLEKWRCLWELSSEFNVGASSRQKLIFVSRQDPFVACHIGSISRSCA